MLRTSVLFALAVLLLAASCASGPGPTEVAAGADPPPPTTLLVDAHDRHRPPPTTTTVAPTTTTVVLPPSTTTTMPPSPPVVHQATAPGGCAGMGDPANDACWDRLYGCENGGYGWAANTGNGYYGGLQFSLSSWRAVGGTGYPHEHPRATQIELARRLWTNGGWRHWPGCSRQFGWL